MCFHSKQSKDAQTLEKRYNAKIEKPALLKMGDVNGFEHTLCPVITNNRPEIIQFSQWGLIPDWAKDTGIQNNTLNAKIETIHEKPSFKASVSKRCLVPADGFYEWQWQDSKGKNKQKFFMHLPDEALFSFAGLWNEWQNQVTGEYYHTYTILTTEANELMAKVHNSKKRMPVIISPQTEMDWLKGGKLSLYNDFLLADALRTTQQMDLWGDL